MHHAETLKHLRQFERADLRVLLRVIDGAAAALKLDAHGDWIISGGRGSIVCNCGLFTIHVGCRSRRHWGLRTVASIGEAVVLRTRNPPSCPSKPLILLQMIAGGSGLVPKPVPKWDGETKARRLTLL